MKLQNRLLVAFLVVSGVSLVLAGSLVWLLVRNYDQTIASSELTRDTIVVAYQVVRTGDLSADPAVFLADIQQLGRADNRRILLIGGGGLVLADSQAHLQGSVVGQLRLARNRSSQLRARTIRLGNTTYLVVETPFLRILPVGVARALVVARPLGPLTAAALTQLLPLLVVAVGVALALALVASYLLSRSIARPLAEFSGAAHEIAAGRYDHRVPEQQGEFGELGRAFNSMAAAIEQARQTQRNFVSTVSHEFRTPLTALLGFSQALVDGSASSKAEVQRAGAILHDEAGRLLRLAQGLLELTRMEAGQMSMSRAPVDVRSSIDRQLELLGRRDASLMSRIQLRVPSESAVAWADSDRVDQILDNLLDNALKHGDLRAPIEVDLTGESGVVVLKISNRLADPGAIINPDRLFERFYRVNGDSKATPGAGLGLAICRELAHAQGGSLTATLSEGALVMRLVLPVWQQSGQSQDKTAT